MSGKIRFLLALSGGTLNFLAAYNKDPSKYKKEFLNFQRDMRFYKKLPAGDGYFNHNEMLFSAFHMKPLLKKGSVTISEALGIEPEDNCTIMIDSGGYSIATGAVSRDKWNDQMAFDLSVKNGNIFPILDIPVTPEADFDTNLQISYDSAKYYKSRKPGNGEIILNVAHGRTMSEVKRWVDKISTVELDGWALGSSHKGNPREILKGMFYMLTSGVLKGSKAFHIFGVSNAEINIYFAVIKHALKRKKELALDFDITYDSSYPVRTAAFMNYYMFPKFDGFSPSMFTNRVDWSTMQNDDIKDGFFCDCPVCSDITDFRGMMTAEKSTEAGIWVAYHNLYTIKKYIQKVASLAEICSDVKGLPEHIFPARIAHNIEVINKCFEYPEHAEGILNREFKAVDVDEPTTTLDEFFG